MRKIFLTFLTFFLFFLPMFAQNPDFERKYNQAKTLYDQGQFDKARTSMQSTLKNLPSLSNEQKNKGNNLVGLCTKAIAHRDRLELSKESLFVGYENGLDSIGFDAGKPALVTARSSASAWCKVEAVRDGQILVRTEFNPEKVAREAILTVKMGRIKTKTVKVVQNARPETTKRVIISTVPDRARISVDGGAAITGTLENSWGSGRYRVRAEKSGYAVKDTIIVVADDMRDETMKVKLVLEPQFGKIRVDVTPEDGFSFDSDQAQFSLNGVMVDQLQREVFSYDDDRDIQRSMYMLHSDGTIPVPAGSLITITASANNFRTLRQEFRVRAGELMEIPIKLEPITGYLNVVDDGDNMDALVYLDGKEIGAVRDIVRRRTLIGQHTVTLEKEGFFSKEASYPVFINENDIFQVDVAMVRYTRFAVSTTPENARVTLDGDYVGNTSTLPFLVKELEPGHVFKLEIVKDNYLPIQVDLAPNYESTDVQQLDFALVPTRQFILSVDERDLQVLIKDKRGGDSTFVSTVISKSEPATLDIPLRKRPYYVEMHRVGQNKSAYRGRLRFNNPAKNKRHLKAWPSGYQGLTINYYLSDIKANVSLVDPGSERSVEGYNSATYKNMGHVGLFSIRLFEGLSTSVVRGGFFLGDNDLKVKSPTGEEKEVTNARYLPAASIILINGDFRVGGEVLRNYIDANALVSYAWYPDVLKNVLGFSHMSGHDLFVGAEVSSRFPVANLSFRMGMQFYFNMMANMHANQSSGSTSVKEDFISCKVEMPRMFVISVCFSLGTQKAKGNNIWRVF